MPTTPAPGHCTHCGTRLSYWSDWPKQCPNPECRKFNYNSPKPVIALVLRSWGPEGSHLDHPGVIVIRRGIEPHKNQWALPGGYIDHNEDWKQAAARECFEELGFKPDVNHLRLIEAVSTPTNYLVLFVTIDEYILTANDWKLTGGTNDEGEVEVLEIDVWGAEDKAEGKTLGVPSHDAIWHKLRFSPG